MVATTQCPEDAGTAVHHGGEVTIVLRTYASEGRLCLFKGTIA